MLATFTVLQKNSFCFELQISLHPNEHKLTYRLHLYLITVSGEEKGTCRVIPGDGLISQSSLFQYCRKLLNVLWGIRMEFGL